MLEILEDCIVFLNERIYISALYRMYKCAVQVKCSTNTSVLYKYKCVIQVKRLGLKPITKHNIINTCEVSIEQDYENVESNRQTKLSC